MTVSRRASTNTIHLDADCLTSAAWEERRLPAVTWPSLGQTQRKPRFHAAVDVVWRAVTAANAVTAPQPEAAIAAASNERRATVDPVGLDHSRSQRSRCALPKRRSPSSIRASWSGIHLAFWRIYSSRSSGSSDSPLSPAESSSYSALSTRSQATAATSA